MKVLVVFAQPKPESFNHAILESFTSGLRDGGHSFEILDLYAIGFDPILHQEDLGQFVRNDVPKDLLERFNLRETVVSSSGGPIKRVLAKLWLRNKELSDIVELINKHTPKDVLAHQEKVANADALVYIFPVWWMNFPAILLGWIQRVLTYGFAYSLTEEGWRGDVNGRISLLKQKKALILNTTFFTEEDYKKTGCQEAMEKIMDDWALRYPGIPEVDHVFFYSVLGVDDETRIKYLETAYRLGKEF
jgi:NAD(P)H dehydrogenase (quinone)